LGDAIVSPITESDWNSEVEQLGLADRDDAM
jgi:hypothetical protein